MLIGTGIWAVAGLVVGLIAVAVIRPLVPAGAVLMILLAMLVFAAAGSVVTLIARRRARASARRGR